LLDATVVPFPVIDAARIELDDAAVMPALTPLAELDPALFGVARFDLRRYEAGGFDALELSVQPDIERINPGAAAPLGVLTPRIDLAGDLRFDAGDRLVLDAPVLHSDGGRALLTADYVRLGYADERNTLRPSDVADATGFSADSGDGTIVVSAGFIDFTGLLSLQGFGGSNPARTAASGIAAFLSDSDIRFNGMLLPRSGSALREVAGRLDAAGDVLFRADRAYVSTLSGFTLDNAGAGGTISFVDGSRGAAFLRDHHAPLPSEVMLSAVPFQASALVSASLIVVSSTIMA